MKTLASLLRFFARLLDASASRRDRLTVVGPENDRAVDDFKKADGGPVREIRLRHCVGCQNFGSGCEDCLSVFGKEIN